jgi:hypothetical protein
VLKATESGFPKDEGGSGGIDRIKVHGLWGMRLEKRQKAKLLVC